MKPPRLLLVLASAITLSACADPEDEVAYREYVACLTAKQSDEACRLEKAKYESAARRARIEAQGATDANFVPPGTRQ